jgi:hypothetical protein
MSTKKHDVPDALLTSLLANYQKPEDLIGENGLLKQLTKLLVEKALDAELAAHLGHDKHEPVANAAGNTRNGKSRKTLKGEFGELPIEIPRDRHGTFEPKLIPKHQTRHVIPPKTAAAVIRSARNVASPQPSAPRPRPIWSICGAAAADRPAEIKPLYYKNWPPIVSDWTPPRMA